MFHLGMCVIKKLAVSWSVTVTAAPQEQVTGNAEGALLVLVLVQPVLAVYLMHVHQTQLFDHITTHQLQHTIITV